MALPRAAKQLGILVGSLLLILGVLLYDRQQRMAYTADEAVPVAALDRWLFHHRGDFYLVGDRVLKFAWPQIPVTVTPERPPGFLATPTGQGVAALLRAALSTIEAETRGIRFGRVEPFERRTVYRGGIVLGVVIRLRNPREDRGIFGRPWAGYEEIAKAGAEVGCNTYQEVPYAERHPSVPVGERRWRLLEGSAGIHMTLPLARFEDCLFRSLLIALGLHHTERLAFDPAPLTPEERTEALSVLSLVYHPSVESGMTRNQFLAVLRNEGLLAE